MDVDSAFAYWSELKAVTEEHEHLEKQKELGVQVIFKSPGGCPMLSLDMWNNIILTLPPVDFLSAINTYQEWNQLTTKEKPKALFQLVLPKLMEYLPKETMLIFRKISHESKKVLDDVLMEHQTSPYQLFKDGLQESSRRKHFLSQIEAINKSYDFRRKRPRDNVVNLMSAFDNNILRDRQILDNPILSGHLSFTLGRAIIPSRNPAPLLPREMQLIENPYPVVGYEYWLQQSILWGIPSFPRSLSTSIALRRLDLEIHYSEDTNSAIKLIYLLGEVTYLRTLKIYVGPDQRSKASLESIEVEMLPVLEYLEFLELQGADVPSFSAKLLRKYGNRLTHLVCNGSVFEQSDEVSVDFINEFLPVLRNLRLRNPGLGPNTIVKLSGVNWNLERLHLNVIRVAGMRIPNLLQCAANFAKDLVELSILGYPQSGDYADSIEETFRLILKSGQMNEFFKLKKLVLEIDYVRSTWMEEFLLYKCSQLQELHLVSPQTHFGVGVRKFSRAFYYGKLERVGYWQRNNMGKVTRLLHIITRDMYLMPSKPINVDSKIPI